MSKIEIEGTSDSQSVTNTFVQVKIPSTKEAVTGLVDHLEAQMKANNYPAKIISGVRLAIDEAITNAAKHAHGYDAAKEVDVRYMITPTDIEVDILDQGPGFDPEALPDPLAPENLERPCGRGVFLMRHYMTKVLYHPPGNHVTMKKTL